MLPRAGARALTCLTLLAARAQEPTGPSPELAQCADCHPAESAAYARTGMARALGTLRPGELARLASVPAADTGFRYAFEGDGPGARIVESFPREGEPPWRDAAPLAFAIGAGEVDRAFALTRGGRLWLAPLEVLGEGAARHAALSPTHTLSPGTRFTQPVTPECLACHTDAPPPRAWPLNQAPAGWQPRGISCAACHGALAEHVRVRAEELTGGGKGDDPLVHARDAGRVARMERCAACHLQGDARIELDPERVGPPPPGTPLLATRAVFVARQPSDEIGFVSQVQRLVLSRCYLESASFPGGGLACESCHDPHRSLSEPEERARVRGACTTCHAQSGAGPAPDCALPSAERPTARDCVDCHLRKTGVFDVAEVTIHDHWIRRRPPPPSAPRALRFPESASADWTLFAWPDAGAPAPAEDPGLWMLALANGGFAERARARAVSGTGTRAAELPMLHHVRGSLAERAGDLPAARAAYTHALELDPELAESATNLAPLLARLGDPKAGRALLDALLARHPLADSAYRNRAVVRLALGDEPGFRADLETAMKLLPDAGLAQALAKHAEQRGDAPGVRRWMEEARRLDPRVK